MMRPHCLSMFGLQLLIIITTFYVQHVFSVAYNNFTLTFYNETFRYAKVNPSKFSSSIVLFISITSGPQHNHLRHAIRNSWIQPCLEAPDCDYRFFVDGSEDKHNHLKEENATYGDLVLRDSCPLFQLHNHPEYINYGNCAPIRGNVDKERPDYPLRRYYKIDWKVCFLRWITSHYVHRVGYHVMVEDDSFVCTNNMLLQSRLLVNMNKHTATLPFRTGTAMYDGFDDSSTIMDGVTAQYFVDYYPHLLNCSKLEATLQTNNTDELNKFNYLAWGNSWMRVNCDWIRQLQDRFNHSVIKPFAACGVAAKKGEFTVNLPCTSRPIILHHHKAAGIAMQEESEPRRRHLCQFMLLLDKIKEPTAIESLHIQSGLLTGPFYNLSMAFQSEDAAGWSSVLKGLEEQESACRGFAANNSIIVNGTKEYPCLFETRRRRGRQRLLSDAARAEGTKGMVSWRDYFDPVPPPWISANR